MNELERAAQAARDAAAAGAPTPVAEIERRAGRLRRGRAVRGAGSLVVALALVVGVVAVFAGEESAEPVATVGELDAVRLSVVFPEDASESRERAVLEERLDAWGAEHSVTGEWPSLEVSVARAPVDDAAYVVGTPGRIVAVADGSPVECPVSEAAEVFREDREARQEAAQVLVDRLDEVERRLSDLDARISELSSGDPERDALLVERSALLEEMHELEVEQARDYTSRPNGGPRSTLNSVHIADAREPSCAAVLDGWVDDGGTPVADAVLDPARPPRIEPHRDEVVSDAVGPGFEMVSLDFSETPVGPALAGGLPTEPAAHLFVDGWKVGTTGDLGRPPSTVYVALPADQMAVLSAVLLGGGYEAAPAVSVDAAAATPSTTAPATTGAQASSTTVDGGIIDDAAPGGGANVQGALVTIDPRSGGSVEDAVEVMVERLALAGGADVSVVAGPEGIEVQARGLSADELFLLLGSSGSLEALVRSESIGPDPLTPEEVVTASCGSPDPAPPDACVAHELYPGPFRVEVVDGGVAVQLEPGARGVLTSIEHLSLDGRLLARPLAGPDGDSSTLVFPGFADGDVRPQVLAAVLGVGPLDVGEADVRFTF